MMRVDTAQLHVHTPCSAPGSLSSMLWLLWLWVTMPTTCVWQWCTPEWSAVTAMIERVFGGKSRACVRSQPRKKGMFGWKFIPHSPCMHAHHTPAAISIYILDCMHARVSSLSQLKAWLTCIA